MGKSQRFNNKGSPVPGPGNYKIPGFTDEVLKKARKNRQSVEISEKKDRHSIGNHNKNSNDVSVMINLLDNDGSRLENINYTMENDEDNHFSLKASEIENENKRAIIF